MARPKPTNRRNPHSKAPRAIVYFHKNSWKLQEPTSYHAYQIKDHFRERSIAFNTSSSEERLQRLFTRVAQGLLVYDKCNVRDLRSFCHERGIQATLSGLKEGAALIELLEQADEEATFDKLFDLPAELRTRIYELHFASFDISVRTPMFPLCQVSRLVRKESLPVFFNRPLFLDVDQEWVSVFSRPMGLPRPMSLRKAAFGAFDSFVPITEPKIFKMPRHLFQHIRQFTLVPRFMSAGEANVKWTIKLDAKTGAAQLSKSTGETQHRRYHMASLTAADINAENGVVERGLRALVGEICKRDKKNFRRVDMAKILTVFDEAWKFGMSLRP